MSVNNKSIEAIASRKGVTAGGDFLTIPAMAKAANAPESWVRKQVSRYADQMESRLAGDRRMQPHYPPTLADSLREEWAKLNPDKHFTLPELKNTVGGEGAWLRKQLNEIGAKPVTKYARCGKELPHYTEQTAQAVLTRYYEVPATGLDRFSRGQIKGFFKIPHHCLGWLVDLLRSCEDIELRRTHRSGGSFEKHYPFGILEDVQTAIAELPDAGDRLTLDDICASFPQWRYFFEREKFLSLRSADFPAEVCRYGEGLVDIFYPATTLSLIREKYPLQVGYEDGWREELEIVTMLQASHAWVRQALTPYAQLQEDGYKHPRGQEPYHPTRRQERYYPESVLEPLRKEWEKVSKAGRWLNEGQVAEFCDAWEREIEHLIGYNEDKFELRMGQDRIERHYPLEVAFEIRATHLYR
ncbi:MAG: hypothetical protein NUV85_02555 [Candidatus Berkelbacteria bacterium]|nr:hypothetical protein [Candidatus Berkelbacteria bacterium]